MADVQNIVIKYTSDTSGITDAEKAYDALTLSEKRATDQVKKLEAQQTELGKSREQVASLTAAHERLAISVRKAQEANNAQAIRSTTLAYQSLGKQLDVAKQKYTELASKTKEVKESVDGVKGSSSELSTVLKNMAQYAIGAFSIQSVLQFGKAVYDNTLKMEGLNKRLGMLGDAKAEFQYLVNLSNKFGLNLESTADAFSSFAIASTASGISLTETKKIFEGVSTAITALQLPAEQGSRVFYALQQMMSKGKVSAEELRQQLGEALPGSFALAVQASGKTEQEFNKLLETGQILSKDFVPKFAELLGSKYEGSLAASLDSATVATNRLSTAWTLFVTSLGNSEAIKNVSDFLTKSLTGFSALTSEYLNNVERIYMGIPGLIMSLGGASDKLKAVSAEARDAMAKDEMQKSNARVSKRLADERIKAEKDKGKTLKQINDEAIKNEKSYADAIIQEQNNLITAQSANEAKAASLAIKRYETAIAIEKNVIEASKTTSIKKPKELENQKRANDAFLIEEKRKADEFQKYQEQINGAHLATTMKNDIQANIDLIKSANVAGIDTEDSILHQAFVGDRDKFVADAAQAAQEAAKASGEAFLSEMEANQEAIQASKDMLIDLSIQSIGAINELFSASANAEIKHIQELNDRKVISDSEANKRILAEKRKMFIADKIAAAIEVAINTLVAISQVGAQLGIAGIPLGVLIAAQGALAEAAILAKPMPFAKGTKSVPDRYGKPNQDSVPAMLTPGEKVFPVHTSTLYNDGLDAIFDHKVSPDVVNALGKGELKQQVVVINDNKDVIKAIREKDTMIIEDRALYNAIAVESRGMISRNKRRFKR